MKYVITGNSKSGIITLEAKSNEIIIDSLEEIEVKGISLKPISIVKQGNDVTLLAFSQFCARYVDGLIEQNIDEKDMNVFNQIVDYQTNVIKKALESNMYPQDLNTLITNTQQRITVAYRELT